MTPCSSTFLIYIAKCTQQWSCGFQTLKAYFTGLAWVVSWYYGYVMPTRDHHLNIMSNSCIVSMQFVGSILVILVLNRGHHSMLLLSNVQLFHQGRYMNTQHVLLSKQELYIWFHLTTHDALIVCVQLTYSKRGIPCSFWKFRTCHFSISKRMLQDFSFVREYWTLTMDSTVVQICAFTIQRLLWIELYDFHIT